MANTVVMEGIVEIEGANAVWMDPVAVLSSSYSHFELSRGRYYSRASCDRRNCSTTATGSERITKSSRKRKRKKTYAPNEKELLAELRHQEARLAILNAHSSFLATSDSKISSRVSISRSSQWTESIPTLSSPTNGSEEHDLDFRQLAEVWQAPLYELTIIKKSPDIIAGGGPGDESGELVSSTYPLFNAVIEHEGEETIADCAGALFLLPKQCRFLINTAVCREFNATYNITPSSSNSGYNLIVIDPPWENKSVHRNSLYPMMPNRQLLSLPIKQLIHREGALIALWLTNREKLHQFVESELFPAWGVKLAATWYWLKLNGSGEMISPLDLQHHKPYECLLLGYLFGARQEACSHESAEEENMIKLKHIGQSLPPEKFVVMSIPGDHSRKPPMGSLLAQYAPGPHPIKQLELFARELNTGWTSWGNEPLHFQNMKYFQPTLKCSS